MDPEPVGSEIIRMFVSGSKINTVFLPTENFVVFKDLNNYDTNVFNLLEWIETSLKSLGRVIYRAGHALFFTLRACAFALFGGALRAGAFALFFGP